MKNMVITLLAVLILAASFSVVEANDMCNGKEGSWIVAPAKNEGFGNYYLGGLCDENSCYHIAICNDEKGEDIAALIFTCQDIGDGSNSNLWVFVDPSTGEKQEINANLMEVNEILKEITNSDE
jgi:hypothetical protein